MDDGQDGIRMVNEVMMKSPLASLAAYDIRLCSGSPRRRELLALLDIRFRVDTSRQVDETYPPTMDPAEVPLYLARQKAQAYREDMSDRDIIITADTVVISEGEILGKPSDASQARRMLERLSGRTHAVVTGTCVMTRDVCHEFAVTSQVTFASLSHDEIEYYISRYSPLDKAGAYGIQEWIGAVGVERIDGSFYNVMGLPVQRLYRVLKELSLAND